MSEREINTQENLTISRTQPRVNGSGGRRASRRRTPPEPIGLSFGETGESYEVGSDAGRIAPVAIPVNGVPGISVEEALWMASTVIESV